MNAAFLVNPRLRRQFDHAQVRGLESDADAVIVARQKLQAIQQVWADAVADVPYYSSLVASGAAPARIESWTDVAALPVLTRRLLQERPTEFIRRSGAPSGVM